MTEQQKTKARTRRTARTLAQLAQNTGALMSLANDLQDEANLVGGHAGEMLEAMSDAATKLWAERFQAEQRRDKFTGLEQGENS